MSTLSHSNGPEVEGIPPSAILRPPVSRSTRTAQAGLRKSRQWAAIPSYRDIYRDTDVAIDVAIAGLRERRLTDEREQGFAALEPNAVAGSPGRRRRRTQ